MRSPLPSFNRSLPGPSWTASQQQQSVLSRPQLGHKEAASSTATGPNASTTGRAPTVRCDSKTVVLRIMWLSSSHKFCVCLLVWKELSILIKSFPVIFSFPHLYQSGLRSPLSTSMYQLLMQPAFLLSDNLTHRLHSLELLTLMLAVLLTLEKIIRTPFLLLLMKWWACNSFVSTCVF